MIRSQMNTVVLLDLHFMRVCVCVLVGHAANLLCRADNVTMDICSSAASNKGVDRKHVACVHNIWWRCRCSVIIIIVMNVILWFIFPVAENFPSGLIEGRVLASLVLRVTRASKQKTEKETLDFFKSCLKIEEWGVMGLELSTAWIPVRDV